VVATDRLGSNPDDGGEQRRGGGMTEVSARLLRDVVGHYPSGVTVVTGMWEGLPAGFSCQSFHSLSLEPPMIMLLVGRASTSWPRIRNAGRFCVNILADSQEELARTFAISGADKFADVGWTPSPNGSPILDGGTGWLDCDLGNEYDGGDHLIVTGHVTALGAETSLSPLVFHRGMFRTMNEEPPA
jgi:3-hydroxy-9,10-secoandrosta-1,3,5(10)-triene-9,17-dione monooxygenase reductase component